jgi:hypothetical protein
MILGSVSAGKIHEDRASVNFAALTQLAQSGWGHGECELRLTAFVDPFVEQGNGFR